MDRDLELLKSFMPRKWQNSAVLKSGSQQGTVRAQVLAGIPLFLRSLLRAVSPFASLPFLSQLRALPDGWGRGDKAPSSVEREMSGSWPNEKSCRSCVSLAQAWGLLF